MESLAMLVHLLLDISEEFFALFPSAESVEFAGEGGEEAHEVLHQNFMGFFGIVRVKNHNLRVENGEVPLYIAESKSS